jgi:molecular chaperone Hsp33
LDSLITTVVEGENIFGVAAVTTELVEQARCLHGSSPTATAALGRLLTGGVLMGALLKETSHRVILQINSRGPVQRIVVEADGEGYVRGYLGQSAIHIPSRNGKLDVGRAVGKGILHVIKETGTPEPSSGTSPLESGEIAEDLASYLLHSEQIPGAVSLGVFVSPDHAVTAAGGFMLQFHSTIEDELLTHVEQALAAVPHVTTMIREDAQPYDILQRAFGGLPLEQVRQTTPRWRCSCSRERVIRALVALGAEELRQLIVEEPVTELHCEFCSTTYAFDRQQLETLLAEAL